MAYEYRVRWRREGRALSTRIYQQHGDAYKKAMRVKALDAIKDESERYHDLPPMVEEPTIEIREVGPWRTDQNHNQPGEPSEYALQDARRWASPETWEPQEIVGLQEAPF